LAQFVSTHFSDIFCSDSPSSKSNQSCSHLTSSQPGELTDPHLRIEDGKLRDDSKKVDRVETHPHHLKRFIVKLEIESHGFLLQSFRIFFKKFLQRYQR